LTLLGLGAETVEREVEDIEHHLTPQTLAALTALVAYWKNRPAELQAFRQFQARDSSAKNSETSNS
jgi:Mn-dependent DtxR family transcriptional regulator